MADLSITANNVVPEDEADLEQGTAGEAVTAGQPVYTNISDDRKLYKADADAVATAKARGVAVNSAGAGQPLVIAKAGKVGFGAILTAGVVYAVSKTAGGIAPVSDLTTGDYITTLGIADDTSTLDVNIQVGPAKG